MDKKFLLCVLFIPSLVGCGFDEKIENDPDRIGGGTTTTTMTTIRSSYFKWVSDITVEDYYNYLTIQYFYTNTNVKIKDSNITIIAMTNDLETYREPLENINCNRECPSIRLFDKNKDIDNNITISITGLKVEWSLIGEIIKSMKSSKDIEQSLIDEKTIEVETEIKRKSIWYYSNNGYNLYLKSYTDTTNIFDIEVTINGKSFAIYPSSEEWADFLVSERDNLIFPEIVNITLIRKGCKPYQRGFYRYLVPRSVFEEIKEFKDTIDSNVDVTKPRPVLVIDKQETWMRVFATQEKDEEIGSCVTQE